MPASERRNTRRLIMKVPLKFRPAQAPDDPEREAASMNICHHGVYFATDQALPKGVLLQVHLKMPREVVGDDVAEWCFTGRVAHVEPLGAASDKTGVGVQFIYYEVPRASLWGRTG
jgi:Tfp pilus assembly protein PilZ